MNAAVQKLLDQECIPPPAKKKRVAKKKEANDQPQHLSADESDEDKKPSEAAEDEMDKRESKDNTSKGTPLAEAKVKGESKRSEAKKAKQVVRGEGPIPKEAAEHGLGAKEAEEKEEDGKGKKPRKINEEAKAKNARKSKAYGAAKRQALKDGLSVEEATALAKEATHCNYLNGIELPQIVLIHCYTCFACMIFAYYIVSFPEVVVSEAYRNAN